uniref:Uncharacterized protein n=1 Tax=Rhizophora mucronata TaxID=61149 RepID=A0A2P2Q975_RHIMU
MLYQSDFHKTSSRM